MAGYERKSIQILGPTGFTCLPPPDKSPTDAQLLLQNFRHDTLGRLISRAGYEPKIVLDGAGVAHSAATSATAGQYYVGVNSDTTGAGGSLWYGGIGGTEVTTGFDGNRLGFATMNGYEWVMNRAKQGRMKLGPAPLFEDWTLAAPLASPTATLVTASTPSPSASYTYAPATSYPYTHYLTIAGTTYSFVEDIPYPGAYGPDQVALVISILAQNDPNCSVTYPGSGQVVTITPIVQFTTISVSGSDGNAPAVLANGTVTNRPNGVYRFYVTYVSADQTLESNPSPASAAIDDTSGSEVNVDFSADVPPPDARVGFINIYAVGGTLPGAYLIGQVPATSTNYTWTDSEAVAVNTGAIMPASDPSNPNGIDHDIPPACAGLIGPHFSRLYAWSTAANINRLFWTPPDQPQYWSTDPQEGDWVDVGLETEAIVWCSIHANLLIIYKERTIWMMIGSDPGTAQLEQVYEGPGPVNQWALAPAGQIDYYVAPNGLKVFDMSMVHDITSEILPLFNTTIVNSGPLTPPGSLLPGGPVNSAVALTFSAYAVTLGHAFNRLFISYAEQGSGAPQWNLLVFEEGGAPESQTLLNRSGRWFYERTAVPNTQGFYGFLFDGTYMLGLTGAPGADAAGYSLADFQSRVTDDMSQVAKAVTGATVSVIVANVADSTGYTANVSCSVGPTPVGSGWHSICYAGGVFSATTFSSALNLPLEDPNTVEVWCRNFSTLLHGCPDFCKALIYDCWIDVTYADSTTGVWRANATRINQPDPFYGQVLNSGLAIDSDTTTYAEIDRIGFTPNPSFWNGLSLVLSGFAPSDGTGFTSVATPIECVYASHYEDVGLPDNDKMWLEVRIDYEWTSAVGSLPANVSVGFNGGVIAPVSLGTLVSSARQTVAFGMGLLPGAEDAGFLARSIAVFVDAIAAGQLTLHNVFLYYYVEARQAHVASAIPTDLASAKIKECRELELDIDATPGSCLVDVVSDMPGHSLAIRHSATVAAGGRSLWRYPFPTTQGYLWQVSVGGPSFRLYSARLFMRELEVAVEGYECAGGFVWDSMEQALRGGEVSTVDQVRFEMDSSGACSVQIFTDLPGEAPSSKGTYALTAGATNRAWVLVPMPDGIEARSVRLQVSGAGFRLYRAQVRHAAIGRFLEGTTPSGADDVFRALEFDYYAPKFSMFKRLEIDLRATGTVTVTVYTDQDSQPLAAVWTTTVTTPSGRAAIALTLPPGIRGRLMRVKLDSPNDARIYHLRLWTRAVTDPSAAWAWEDFPLESSDILASWTDFIIEETSPTWRWTEIDMVVTGG